MYWHNLLLFPESAKDDKKSRISSIRDEAVKTKDKMASLMRVAARRGCQVLRSKPVTKIIQPACFISTNKKKDSAAVTQNVGSRAEDDVADKDEVRKSPDQSETRPGPRLCHRPCQRQCRSIITIIYSC